MLFVFSYIYIYCHLSDGDDDDNVVVVVFIQIAKCNKKEFAGWSALHFCVDGASLGCLEALLSSTYASVDLQARNLRNETALDLARSSTRQGGGYAATCEAIIKRIEREDEKSNV